MRKIEEQMLTALVRGRNFKSGNTEVVQSKSGAADVYLHGNHIACVSCSCSGDMNVAVNYDTLRRWPTRTTASRLRALGCDVFQRKNVLYCDQVEVCDV